MREQLVEKADTLLGDRIEAAVSFKHRRRLRRLGWDHVFERSDPASGRVASRNRATGASSRS